MEVPSLNLRFWNPDYDEESPLKNKTKCLHLSTNSRKEKLLQKFDFSDLSVEEKQEILLLVSEFADVFHLEGDAMPSNKDFDHEIILKEAVRPIQLKQFRIPFALKGEMERNINEMRDADLIEESNSPWNLPTFLVPKKLDKNGEMQHRIVTDMPIIDEILGKLGNANYFCVLDLWKGFYQIGLAEKSRQYMPDNT